MVEHGGYRRAIISRNLPLVDEDGYDIDSDDDDERIQDAMAATAEADPYSSIHLERETYPAALSPSDYCRTDCSTELLAPLTSVTDLPNHPTLSRAFTSLALTELANQGSELMHKENAALSKVRPLLTKVSGDHTWANCEMFLGPNDREYFDDRFMSRMLKRRKIEPRGAEEDDTPMVRINGSSAAQAPVNGEQSQVNGVDSGHQKKKKAGAEDMTMTDGDERTAEKQTEKDHGNATNGNSGDPSIPSQDEPGKTDKALMVADKDRPQEQDSERVNGDSGQPDQSKGKGKEPEARPATRDGDVAMVDGGAEPIRSATRPRPHTQADDAEAANLVAALTDESFIHPIFLAPKAAHPDRDCGLPEAEAEDVRRLLQLYVQKQEEVCRGARKLYEGLLKADRMRKTVLAWSKAEAHCGPNRDMSDGEDWYDKEEWGLTEDLKKGQDEEEEDTAQPQKKTRNRNK